VIKSEKLLNRLTSEFRVFLEEQKIKLIGYKPSDLKGKKGNQEYLFIGEYVK
jgi:predicted rRNA methylase YqxC with S4 and FtsJ domains